MPTKQETILLAEDDQAIAEPLVFGLENEGFQVLHVTKGNEVLDIVQGQEPDLILLDVMLPGMDGFTVCKRLRRESTVPIIMLTARGQEMDRVMGLELGADDYIVKPFSFREMLARVHAALRRREMDTSLPSKPPDQLVIGALTLDRTAHSVLKQGKPLEVSQREFELLKLLMERCGQAIERQDLIDRVWGEEWIGDPHTLDVHIRWLREKIEADPSKPRYLQTLRGFGYRFVDPHVKTRTP